MNIHPDHDGAAMRKLATFERYEDAQELVDRLADRGFAVEKMTIVGRDVRIVEKVTGRMDVWRAALGGLLAGALLGLLFGLLFGAIFTHDGVSLLALVIFWVVVGAFWGALLGVMGFLLSGGNRRNFASASGITATYFDVMVEESAVEEAALLAAASTANRTQVRAGSARAPGGNERTTRP